MSQFGSFKEKALESFGSLLKDALDQVEHDSLIEFERIASMCESPIETAFAAALYARCAGIGSLLTWRLGSDRQYLGNSMENTEVAPQFEIESVYRETTYRVDFAIVHQHRYGDVSRLAIECDGHDYHERTKKQAARDRQKDRDLQLMGWKILRFTGSEIHADADECSRQIFDHIGDDGMSDYQRAHNEGRAQ